MGNLFSIKKQKTYNGTRKVSSVNDVGITGKLYSRELKENWHQTSYTEINSKLIKDLNIKDWK